jgi:two-component system phosphate regulon response regulator PhoB
MANKNILIIEDDRNILELIRYNLVKEGYHVLGAMRGEEGLEAAKAGNFDIILLDLMLPDLDGLEICRALKRDIATAHVLIIMVTAKGEEADIVTGLELGADDYVVKPFSPKVLTARIKAVLRRKTAPRADKSLPINMGYLEIHPGRREVRIKNKPIDLTFTEFELLHHLARRPGWVFTRHQLVDGIKGEDYPVTDRSIDVQIAGLRKKLGEFGEYIETIRGVGYRFSDKETDDQD